MLIYTQQYEVFYYAEIGDVAWKVQHVEHTADSAWGTLILLQTEIQYISELLRHVSQNLIHRHVKFITGVCYVTTHIYKTRTVYRVVLLRVIFDLRLLKRVLPPCDFAQTQLCLKRNVLIHRNSPILKFARRLRGVSLPSS